MPILFWPSTLITTTSFIFIFHVISDPKTSPTPPIYQFIFGASIGLLDFILRFNKILPAESIAYMTVQMVFGFIYFKIPNLKNSKI